MAPFIFQEKAHCQILYILGVSPSGSRLEHPHLLYPAHTTLYSSVSVLMLFLLPEIPFLHQVLSHWCQLGPPRSRC